MKDYSKLSCAKLMEEKGRGLLIEVNLRHEGGKIKLWFPESHISFEPSGIFASDWIIGKKQEEMVEKGLSFCEIAVG